MKTERSAVDERLVEAVITVKGDVQRVGYRDFVAKIARKLQITGYAENTKPYDVRIIAAGKKKNVQEFIKTIDVKTSPINVESVETEFRKHGKKYKYFEIKRGDMTEELSERIDVASSVMYEIRDLQKDSLLKQDETIQKMDSGNKMLGEKIDSGFGRMDQNFTTLRQDYGRISDTMGEINSNIEKLTNAIIKLAEKK